MRRKPLLLASNRVGRIHVWSLVISLAVHGLIVLLLLLLLRQRKKLLAEGLLLGAFASILVVTPTTHAKSATTNATMLLSRGRLRKHKHLADRPRRGRGGAAITATKMMIRLTRRKSIVGIAVGSRVGLMMKTVVSGSRGGRDTRRRCGTRAHDRRG